MTTALSHPWGEQLPGAYRAQPGHSHGGTATPGLGHRALPQVPEPEVPEAQVGICVSHLDFVALGVKGDVRKLVQRPRPPPRAGSAVSKGDTRREQGVNLWDSIMSREEHIN